MSRDNRLYILVEGGIVAVLAALLSYATITIGGTMALVFGGLPLTIFALRRGLKPALAVGLLWGLLQWVLGNAIILSLVQFIVEYPIAFTFNGLAGLAFIPFQKALRQGHDGTAHGWLWGAAFIGTFARYVWHFLGGMWFWSSNLPAGISAVWFSFVPNFLSIPLTAIPIAIVLSVIYSLNKKLYLPKR